MATPKKRSNVAAAIVDEQALVAEAVILNRSIKTMTSRLEVLKSRIRDIARDRVSDQEGSIELPSLEGTATVVFVSDSVNLIAGADPNTLRGIIPFDLWTGLFEERIVLSRGFEDRLKFADAVDTKRIKRLVEWTSNAPRVLLPK